MTRKHLLRQILYFGLLPALVVGLLTFIIPGFGPRMFRASSEFQIPHDPTAASVVAARLSEEDAALLTAVPQALERPGLIRRTLEEAELTDALARFPSGELTPEGQQTLVDMVKGIQQRTEVVLAEETDEYRRWRLTYIDIDQERTREVAHLLIRTYLDELTRTFSRTISASAADDVRDASVDQRLRTYAEGRGIEWTSEYGPVRVEAVPAPMPIRVIFAIASGFGIGMFGLALRVVFTIIRRGEAERAT